MKLTRSAWTRNTICALCAVYKNAMGGARKMNDNENSDFEQWTEETWNLNIEAMLMEIDAKEEQAQEENMWENYWQSEGFGQ